MACFLHFGERQAGGRVEKDFFRAHGAHSSSLVFRHTRCDFKPNGEAISCGSEDTPADTTAATNYTGTIVLLNGSLYILRDDVNETWYHLDDQQLPSKFLGKKVAVRGKLDPSADMIHVQDIEPAKT